MNEFRDLEYIHLIISIINSFVLTHPNEIMILLPNYSQITQRTIKILYLLFEMNSVDKNLYENCLRLLKSLALNNLLAIDKFFSSGIICKLDKLLLSDISFQYVTIILNKISEASYYKPNIYSNENIIDLIIHKLLSSQNKKLISYILSFLVTLTEFEDVIAISNGSQSNLNKNSASVEICKRISSLGLLDSITYYIRFYENNIKILALNLLINVLINSSINEKEPLLIWSNSMLLNIIKDGSNKLFDDINIQNLVPQIFLKTRCMNIISLVNKKFSSLQNIFYNLDGVEILLKELKSAFTEEKIKEMDEHMKTVKMNRTKKGDRVFLLEKDETQKNISLTSNEGNSLDELEEYKRSILDAMANVCSSHEECRKKITESKEMSIVLYLIEESNTKIILACANLVLSLSRSHISVKKYLHEYDITSTLFKLSNHSNLEIQIAVTNSLCNFLLDYSSNTSDIIDCVSKLLKILSTTKHSKIRLNSVFSIKNILYYISSMSTNVNSKDLKKSIMKKITYDYLLSLLDDEETGIQEQALIIIRFLLHKTPEDIEEVFNNCKTKLIKKIEDKIKSDNQDLVLQSLYVLMNISNGNEKQKSVLLDNIFLNRISQLMLIDNLGVKSACVLILHNLIVSSDKNSDQNLEKKVSMLKDYGIIKGLQKIATEEEDIETRNNANVILSQIKVK